MSRSSKLYASLLGIGEVQRLNLRLIELASFNDFDGPKVVKDLLDHKDLWQACVMDREGYCWRSKELRRSPIINLIKLRDMGEEQIQRTGKESWNIDTLFILAKVDKKAQNKLFKLALKWKPNELDWLKGTIAGNLLGGCKIGTQILRVWWD